MKNIAMPRVQIRSFAVCSTALICSIYGMAQIFLICCQIWIFGSLWKCRYVNIPGILFFVINSIYIVTLLPNKGYFSSILPLVIVTVNFINRDYPIANAEHVVQIKINQYAK
jgi:hypothetical protein